MWRAASVSFITITTSTGPTDKPTPDGGDQTFHHGRHVASLAVRAECVADFREVGYVPPLRHGRRLIGRRHSVVSPLAVAPRRAPRAAEAPLRRDRSSRATRANSCAGFSSTKSAQTSVSVRA